MYGSALSVFFGYVIFFLLVDSLRFTGLLGKHGVSVSGLICKALDGELSSFKGIVIIEPCDDIVSRIKASVVASFGPSFRTAIDVFVFASF